MSGMAMFIEGERAVRSDVLSERAQELDTVVSRYLPMFYKRAFRFLGNVPDAEDAVQDALLSAYKHLGQFRGQAQLSTWLTTIVTNAARMQLRRRGNYCRLMNSRERMASHSPNSYLIRSRVQKKSAPQRKHETVSSTASSSSRQSCAEQFSCARSTV